MIILTTKITNNEFKSKILNSVFYGLSHYSKSVTIEIVNTYILDSYKHYRVLHSNTLTDDDIENMQILVLHLLQSTSKQTENFNAVESLVVTLINGIKGVLHKYPYPVKFDIEYCHRLTLCMFSSSKYTFTRFDMEYCAKRVFNELMQDSDFLETLIWCKQ